MRHIKAKETVFFSSLLVWAAFAEAPLRQAGRIVYDVKVYTWSDSKRVWSEGQAIKRITETYDARGQLAGEILADGKGRLLEKTVILHQDDRLVKLVYGPDEALRRVALVERDGNSETETTALPDRSGLFIDMRKYDSNGRVTESEHYDAQKEIVFRKNYRYDEKGNLIAIEVRNPNGERAFEITYQYHDFDKSGHWLSRSEYYAYGDVRKRPHEIVYRKIQPMKKGE